MTLISRNIGKCKTCVKTDVFTDLRVFRNLPVIENNDILCIDLSYHVQVTTVRFTHKKNKKIDWILKIYVKLVNDVWEHSSYNE